MVLAMVKSFAVLLERLVVILLIVTVMEPVGSSLPL